MMSNLVFSFLKSKTGFKLEDKLPNSSGSRSSSIWSYSYDLYLTEMCDAAAKVATRPAKCGDARSDVENNKTSQLSTYPDLDDNFIFQSNKQVDELKPIERIKEFETEALNYKNLKNAKEYQLCSPKNKLESTYQFSCDESIDSLKRLRLSDVQKKRSWLERIILPFPKEINDEVQCTKQAKSKPHMLAVVIDYLEQFIQKTAVPAMQKYEQLKRDYNIEKKKWKKQVESLKRQNSSLKSELKEIRTAYKDAERELSDFKLRYSQTHSKIEVNTHRERSPSHKSVSSISSFDIEQNTGLKVRYEQSGKWTAAIGEDKESITVDQTDSSLSCKAYCGSQKLPAVKVRRQFKTEFLDPEVLKLSDSWYSQNKDSVMNLHSELCSGVDLDQITSEDTVQRLKHIKEQQSEGCNESVSQIMIRSKWL